MQQGFLEEVRTHIYRNKIKHILRKFVYFLCCVVVFCTTYALILPAITLEQTAYCGLEEHTHSEECYQYIEHQELVCNEESLQIHSHSESCYDSDANLVCGLADYVVHTHAETCFYNGQLVCTLPERSAHVHNETCYIPGETEPEVLHMHKDDCYTQQNGELICTIEAYEGHAHDNSCYVIGNTLVCTLVENHVHQESCYTYPLICTLSTDPHIHSADCYGIGEQLCTTEEGHVHGSDCSITSLSCENTEEGHEHNDSCYHTEVICTIPENHFHDSSCYASVILCGKTEGECHEHGADCYSAEPQLTCTLTENHFHDDNCYAKELICTVPEDPGHSHTDDCYQQERVLTCGMEEGQPEPTEPAEPILNCTEPVAQEHVHGESCFITVGTEPEPICGITDEGHVHTEDCYGCAIEEHTHTLACYSDPEADVESAAVWESTFAHVALTGDWPTDVVAIAQTQIGYTESTRNYEVWEDNSIHGYTRYGAWYGVPYGDWCGMFASFCLDYAGVEGMPYNYGVRPWIEDLASRGLYYSARETKAQKGNLIFFDWEGDGLSDHVGIVAEVQEAQDHTGASIKAIEGNASNCVKYVYYSPDDPVILGYGLLPGQERVPVTIVEPDDVPSSLQAILICGMPAHTHGEICYRADGECICSLEEHIHTIDCVDSSIPVGYADGGTMMRMMKATRDGSSMKYHTDITDLFTGVAIYDSNDNLVYESTSPNGSGTVTIGENCRIIISFAEDNFNQFSTNSVLTYQIPANLSANLVGTGVIINREYEIIANYEIDNNQLKITPLNYGEGNFFAVHNDVTLSIEFYAEVIHSNDSSQTDINFNGNYKVTINFNENPKIDVVKTAGEYDPYTRTITYQSKVTAYSGTMPVKYLWDNWQPKENVSFVQGSMQVTDKDGNPMNMDEWTFATTENGFTLTPETPVELNHQEFFTVTYQVRVDDDISENFNLNNSFYAEGVIDEKKYTDTDSTTTPVTVTNVEKSGVHVTEDVEGTTQDVLKWTVNIDNSTLDTITITDELGDGQYFCLHQPISITATKQDGSKATFSISWDQVTVVGNKFTMQLPSETTADGKNDYKEYVLTYYSHFTLDGEGTGLQVFENTVTTNVTIGGKPTFGTGSIGVVGIPPGIDKTATSDNEWITFTITCRMPGGLYNQPNVLVYDSLGTWFNGRGYYFLQNPDSMRIVIQPDGADPYELVPYNGQDSLDNTYLIDNAQQDFTIYFNTDQATSETSVWKCEKDSTMTITYRVSRYTPLLDKFGGNPDGRTLQDVVDEFHFLISNRAKLDYAPGFSVEYTVDHPLKELPAPLKKTAVNATQNGKVLDGVYDYCVHFRPSDSEYNVFNTLDNGYPNDVQSLTFIDSYDSRLEYVEDSFVVTAWAKWTPTGEPVHQMTYEFSAGEGPMIIESGDTTTMVVNAADLMANYNDDWLYGDLVKGMQLLQKSYYFEFSYQLKVKDSIKETTTEGVLLLDNTANIEWTDNTGPRTLTPAKNRVEYDTGVLQKGMQVVENSNLVDFTILVNHNALDLAVDGDSYVLYDTMSSNLMLLYDTLKIETVDKTSKATKEELSPTACKFEYDMDQNKMTLLLPDNEVIRLTYRCKVEGSRGEQVDISNKVELLGRSAIQDIVNSKFQIMDHEGTADGSSKEFVLQKRDGNNHQALAGVTFSLYGDVVPADYHEGTHTFIVDHTNVSDESKKHTHTMYYYGSFTTGTDGIAHISHTQLTKRFLYALIEEAPPTGYVALSEPYFFYMEEREDNALAEMPCLKDGQLVVIENYPIGYELPATGGTGYELYTVGGTLLMLAALILLYNQKKCRKEDSRSS